MSKLLFVLGALALSTAAHAADGSASFRFAGGEIVSFDYQADLKAGTLSGSVSRRSYNAVELSSMRDGGWSGTLGGTGLSVNPIQTEQNGLQSITIQTIEGEYIYTVEKTAKGGLEISTVGQRGDLLHASLTANSLSVDSPIMSFEAVRDTKDPTYFTGTAVIDFWSLDTDSVDFKAQGSLDPMALAKQDTALFLILYVLPFHMGN